MHCSRFSQRTEHTVQDCGPDRWNIKRIPPNIPQAKLVLEVRQKGLLTLVFVWFLPAFAHLASVCGNVPCAVQDKLKCCVLVSTSRVVPLWADLLFMCFCKYQHKLLLVAPSWFSRCLSELGNKPRTEIAPYPWGPEPCRCARLRMVPSCRGAGLVLGWWAPQRLPQSQGRQAEPAANLCPP